MPLPDPEELDRRFTYHPPSGDKPARFQDIRRAARDFAELLASLVPTGREQSLALTKLEETVMWANAGIARRP